MVNLFKKLFFVETKYNKDVYAIGGIIFFFLIKKSLPIVFLFLLGLIDDIVDLNAFLKLILELIFIKKKNFIAKIAQVYVINAINCIDGIDGYLLTNSIFVFCNLYFKKRKYNLLYLMTISFFLLIFNVYKPFIYMGDSGSLVLGYIISQYLFNSNLKLFTFCLITPLICDTVITHFIMRPLMKKSFFFKNRICMYHNLSSTKFSHLATNILILILNLIITMPLAHLENIWGTTFLVFFWSSVVIFCRLKLSNTPLRGF